MAISRNDFDAIAAGIRQHIADTFAAGKAGRMSPAEAHLRGVMIRECATRLAKTLKARNSSFQPDRFLASIEPKNNVEEHA